MKLSNVISRIPTRSLLGVYLVLGGTQLVAPASASADVVVCNDKSGDRLQAGSETTDLEVTGPCEVKAGGTYTYRNVNIFRDRRKDPDRNYAGELEFVDPQRAVNTDFFAQSIVIENLGRLIVGSSSKPVGPEAKFTIHLWGPEKAPGITCKTDDHCGIPDDVWNSNPNPTPTGCTAMEFPVADTSVAIGTSGHLPLQRISDRAPMKDCFYRYEKLDDTDEDKLAYFGHKVLALSYGGKLELFGDKGATYAGKERSKCKEHEDSCTGTSWVRLNGSIQAGDATPELQVDGDVNWQDGDHIVVTTTDYLPSHSEELIVVGKPSVSGKVTTIQYKNADGVTPGVRWPHNGEVYTLSELPGRLGIVRKSAETRAAVALLSRSIEIVSEGDHAIKDSFTPAAGYFGGHTIVRQGFDTYQVQGVRFHQLGQGGRIMHYPVHFHMARRTPQPLSNAKPPITFVKDSSIDDSMTRWITIHATQGVTLARNVGYMSIGHGFYLEDGTETENKLFSNIGIFARAAVDNDANPRGVPGILTATAPIDVKDSSGFDSFPYFSDSNNPAVFWIMNGWNDFNYNMAAGAGTCGACYWFVPGAISGPSRKQKWFGYASEQRGQDRAALTPLKKFVGNSCSSAMTAFTVNSTTATCNGVNQRDPQKYKPDSMLTMLPSEGATKAYKDQGANKPVLIDENYWPTVGGGGRLATRCSAADKEAKAPFNDVTSDCSTVPRCGEGFEDGCDVTVVDHFTTSFNWAEKNLAAVWMRPFWSLVNESVVTDVQNAGVNFVTSGDFSKSSVITGFWALARKSVFIGNTQKDNPFASNAGPFNPMTSSTLKLPGKNKAVTGLKCAVDPNSGANNVSYCLSKDDGVSIQLSSFSASQRFFSVYDGPAYQEANAYLDIHPTYLTSDGTVTGKEIPGCKPTPANPNPCPFSGYMNGGSPGLLADMVHDRCYLPNAAIGWKQPNGFYYAPAFHSKNLFFADGERSVDIRHFVTEPLFKDDTFDTDVKEVKKQYCYRGTDLPKPGIFQGFTDVDRETVLNDDDGTLTGLTSKGAWTETISVNKEPFFDAPVETPECASDLPLNAEKDAKCAPNTAKTSPYEYVTTAVYPECALSVPDSKDDLRKCTPYVWGSNCATSDPAQNNSCVGVRMYRQLRLTDNDPVGDMQLKRMMGQNTFQRSALTANHGIYYIDTTVSAAKQEEQGAKSINTFVGGQKYDLFFLYAKKSTQQIYELYVGKGKKKDFGETNVKFGYMNIATAKYRFGAAKPPGGKADGDLPKGWESPYDPDSGYLTLMIDMTSLADDFDRKKLVPGDPPRQLGEILCQPKTMCGWDKAAGKCSCAIDDTSNYLYEACHEKNEANEDAICSWSVKDLDCPAKGCPALQITLEDYMPDDAEDHHRPPTDEFSRSDFKKDWDVPLSRVGTDLSGKQCNYTAVPADCGS